MQEKYCEQCGKRIVHKKLKYNPRFCCRACANIWNGAHVFKGMKYQKRKPKEQPINNDYYKRGKQYCKNYNDEDIKCVVCYERRILDNKERDCEL